MSFFDNLEDNLKALESREQRDPAAIARARKAVEAEKLEALRRAPFAAALQSRPFAGALIAACRKEGHSRRILARPAWLDSTLRLEARWDDIDRRLELVPTGDGVRAVFYEGDAETHREPVDLDSPPEGLARRWLSGKR
jgi:hypothetical protein